MDFALLNASIQASHFPPEDPWLAGYPISYYYFGYLMMGFLSQLTGIASNVSYNLSISLVPALAAAGVFGITHNLVRLSGGRQGMALGCGTIACVLLLIIGNLEGVVELIHSRGWGSEAFWAWVGVKGLEGGGSGGSVFPDQYLWWWRATRVIDTVMDGRSLDYTITEFPMFSFLLGRPASTCYESPLQFACSVGITTLLRIIRQAGTWMAAWTPGPSRSSGDHSWVSRLHQRMGLPRNGRTIWGSNSGQGLPIH